MDSDMLALDSLDALANVTAGSWADKVDFAGVAEPHGRRELNGGFAMVRTGLAIAQGFQAGVSKRAQSGACGKQLTQTCTQQYLTEEGVDVGQAVFDSEG